MFAFDFRWLNPTERTNGFIADMRLLCERTMTCVRNSCQPTSNQEDLFQQY